jgi:uncharacterized protein (DUF427 family)
VTANEYHSRLDEIDRVPLVVQETLMKATLKDHVIADTADTVECDGYHYFPRASLRSAALETAPKTADDLRCPHGVQFYDVILGAERFARAAWSYEAPAPKMAHVGGRIGFWRDVSVGE